jgi:predicted ATPase/DNA-binding winged helix-turn-helix (wHTH) protein
MLPDGVRSVYASGECEIDLARRELRVRGSPVPLGARAFEIIEVLAQSAGELVTKDELMNRIWPGTAVMENTLQVHAVALRKALGTHRDMLKTESGRGYRLLGDWTVRRHDAAKPPVGVQRMWLDSKSPVSNFPATVTRLIGRTAAVARLRDLMSAYRVVTLTGPGGIGKSSLALEAARGIIGEFADGGWLVELAPLSDPTLVPSAVAGALGLQLGAGQTSAEALARAVGNNNLLLLLDNCEHVIDAVASLIETIMRRCPRVTIMATSREILRVEGEHVYRVAPLEVPAADEDASDQILSRSAVELFVTRARALNSDFSPRVEDLTEIAAICRQLDGIPLAIEFAAARASVLGVQQVTAGLRDRFELLNAGRRTALPRHRTLRAALDWSYELLPGPEKRLLCCLAIFSGGFTLAATVAVMRDFGRDTPAVPEGIANLVAKSLLALDETGTQTRWYLLEATRAYALEKLREGGEQARVAHCHAEYYLNLFEQAETEWKMRPAAEWRTEYGREIDNLRAALDWSFSPDGDASIAVALTTAAVPLWMHVSLLEECHGRAKQALTRLAAGMDQDARREMKLRAAVGTCLTYTTGDAAREAGATWTRTLEIAASLDDPEYQLQSLWGLWLLDTNGGRHGAALEMAQRFHTVAASRSDPDDRLVGERMVGVSQHHLGDHASARRHLERVFADHVAVRHRSYMSRFPADVFVVARVFLARVLRLQGFPDQAMRAAESSIEDAWAADHVASLGYALTQGTCLIALMVGDLAAAEHHVGVLLDYATRHALAHWHAVGLSYQGVLATMRGDLDTGSRLLRAGADELGGTNPVVLRLIAFLKAEALGGTVGRMGQVAQGLSAVEEALALTERTDEGWVMAELLRIKGDLLLLQRAPGATLAAEDHFRQALDLARRQGALAWELRAAMSLARLLRDQDRSADALALLQPVYDRFTEGFETPDLRAARAFLDELPE